VKIAQIAPLIESVPPRGYGGIERVVSYLTEELVRQGHQVTLFASGDSVTSARLVRCAPRSLRQAADVRDVLPYHIRMLEEVRRRADQFDVLHFHVDVLHYLMVAGFADRMLTTLHGRLDVPDYHSLYAAFSTLPFVSISDDQRRPMPPVNWVGRIHHGLPRDHLAFSSRPRDGYLAFLGRISPEKRPDRAIEIASRSGRQLRIAAKVDAADRDYWQECIEPMIRAHSNVEYVGEVDDGGKAAFLGNASALLFPIDWCEPFGLVMIEAMACGTPVIAWRRGAVCEVIDEATTGFIVDSVEQAVAAVDRIGSLDRRTVRRTFERRFTADRMARDYVEIYRQLPSLRCESAAIHQVDRLFPSPSATGAQRRRPVIS
jgi:glycosyltransferase involved in cell wall biosynthesis